MIVLELESPQNLICKGVNGCTPVDPLWWTCYERGHDHNQLANNVALLDMSMEIMWDWHLASPASKNCKIPRLVMPIY